jgi:thymidylate synthase (FAD)
MQIVRNGSFIILTPEEELKSQFLRIEKAGRTCYRSEGKKITQESAGKFTRMLIKREHFSVIEHSLMTVLFTDISRGFTHEMVRHRLCSFSQESTRYVDYAKGELNPDLEKFQLKCIVPPHKDENEEVYVEERGPLSLVDMLEEIESFYRALRKAGWIPEDARQVLPNAINADIVVSANFREWRHIFKMRTQKAAHWEIRQVTGDLLEKVKQIIPVIFEDFVEAGVDENGLRYFKKIKLEN